MRRASSGRWGYMLGLAGVLLSGCSSSSTSSGDSHDAGGAAGGSVAGASSEPGGAGGMSASGGASEAGGAVVASQAGAGGSAAGAGGSAAGAGGSAAGAGGSAAQSGDRSGGAPNDPNVFVDQIVNSQGGGPPKCLPRALPTGEPGTANDGQVSCVIGELLPGSCDCSQTARAPLPSAYLTAMKRPLEASGACGGTSGVSCASFCGCEIVQAVGTANDRSSALFACQNDVTPAASSNGFCLVDAMRTDAAGTATPLGNPAIVSSCPTNEKRLLRFVGAGNPESGASVFIACAGATL